MADLNKVSIIISAVDRTRGFSDLQRNFANLQKTADGAGTAMAYLGGVAATSLVAGLVASAGASIRAADEMGKLAQKAGMPVEQFSQLSFAAKQADVSQESLITASKKLSEELVRQGKGSESVAAHLLAQADVFARMEDGAKKTALAVQLFGKSGQDLIPLLNQGSEVIRKQMAEADKLGLTISADFAKQADEFGDNVDRMKAGLVGMGNALAQTVLPSLTRLQQYLVDTEVNMKAAHTAADDLTLALVFMSEVQKQFDPKKFFSSLGGGIISTAAELTKLREAWKATIEGMAGEQDSEIDINRDDGVNPLLPGAGIEEHAKKYRDAIDEMVAMSQKFDLERLAGFEREKERIGQELQAHIDAISARSLTEQEFMADSAAAYDVYYTKLGELSKKQIKEEADERKRYHDIIVDQASLAFGRMAHAARAFGKKGLDAWKAFATAQAVIDTYKAANAAYAALAGIPVVGPALGAAAAAAAIAAGIANVHAIQKTSVAHGGMEFVPREETFLLQRGERVVQPEQNRRLTAFLDDYERRGSSGAIHVTVNLDGQPIYDGISEASRDGRITIHARSII